MDDYDFSVVIPTFNSESVVSSALASVRQQSGVRTQVIVIDGASKDRTCDIVRAAELPDLVLVSEPDTGIYDAINKGVALAQGQLVGVLGSDDTYIENTLQTALRAHQQSGAGIVAGRTHIGGTPRADETYGVNALISGIPFGHNAMFATRQTYALVGNYDTHYKICADADWVHRAIRKGVKCTFVDTPFVEFGPGGESSVQSERIMDETYAIIASNFPGLTMDEAKRLLYGARKWAPATSIADIVARHAGNTTLINSIAAALPGAIPIPATLGPIQALRRLLKSGYTALGKKIRS